jgi:hypothetical protein
MTVALLNCYKNQTGTLKFTILIINSLHITRRFEFGMIGTHKECKKPQIFRLEAFCYIF